MRHRHRSAFAPRSFWVILWLVLGTAAGVVGCSSEARERIKHVLFEYPADRPGGQVAAAESVHPPDSLGNEPWQARPHLVSRHEPFVTRQCQQCHACDRRGANPLPRPQLLDACRECHEPLFATKRYAHGPVASLDCLACHNMHVSPQDALLVAPQTVLCSSCHPAQYTDAAAQSYHRDIEGNVCTTCHDPHFADNPMLLKPGSPHGSAQHDPVETPGDRFGALTPTWPAPSN